MKRERKKQGGGSRGLVGVVVKKTKESQSTAAAAARGVVSQKMKTTQTTTDTAAASSCQPPYFEMIKEALLSLNNPNGSSPQAISKYMEEKYKSTLPSNFKKILGFQLKNSVAKGKLIKIKASYKLYSQETPIDEKKKEEQQRPELTASTHEQEVQDLIRNLKPYVKVPWRKENEPLTPEDMEEAMSYGTRRPTEEEKKKDTKYDFNFEMFIPLDDPDEPDQPKRDNMYVPDVITEEFEETCQKYYNQLWRSEGFEIYDFPLECSLIPLVPENDLENKYLINKAEEALSRFNSINGTSFSFVKVERANKDRYGLVFYITFLAEMPGRRTDSLVTFETRASEDQFNREIIKVRFCRIKGM